jgi:hypothetical protein
VEIMSTLPDRIEQAHRKQLMVDTKRAIALGKSVSQFRDDRTKAIEKWTRSIRNIMEEHGVSDPVACLPAIVKANARRSSLKGSRNHYEDALKELLKKKAGRGEDRSTERARTSKSYQSGGRAAAKCGNGARRISKTIGLIRQGAGQ